jgi:hypothetical protein
MCHTIHDWQISAGGDIMAWMERRYQDADHALCVVSKAYPEKPYSSLERYGGRWAAVATKPNFVLPVLIEPSETPTLLALLKRCDLHGLDEEDARARLETFLTPAAKPIHAPFPGGVKASFSLPSTQTPAAFPSRTLSNIPIRVPLYFVGRNDELSAIEATLQRYEGRVAITALHGPPCKTTLVAGLRAAPSGRL